jgi:hypothetical protein
VAALRGRWRHGRDLQHADRWQRRPMAATSSS